MNSRDRRYDYLIIGAGMYGAAAARSLADRGLRVLVAERSPITSLTSVEIPLGVPRSIEDLKKPEIQDMKEQLIGKLRNTEIDLPLKAGV